MSLEKWNLMEHVDQERDHQNPLRYNQESTMKLPLAPLVSTPPERRRNAIFSTRRGISFFSPRQTLDQLLYEENPTQDPDPTTPRTSGGASRSRTPSQPPPAPWVSPQSPEPEAPTTFNSDAPISYGECLKNHAASKGGHAVDGCREFMPGTEKSLECAACHCHRNFHRKDIGGQQEPFHFVALPSTAAAPPHHQLHFATTVGSTPPTMVDFGGNSGGGFWGKQLQSSSGGHALMQVPSSGSQKRFRTKFNRTQKDRMYEFATGLGWRIQNEDDEQVHNFCNEVGVRRQVFKAWIHNNKKRQN